MVTTVAAGVPFKATAGLHHAVRNTDPDTGFEQHGFLNVLLATEAAAHGAASEDIARILARRDAGGLATEVRGLSSRARGLFLSFGTCSIAEPLSELSGLGLLCEEMASVPEGGHE